MKRYILYAIVIVATIMFFASIASASDKTDQLECTSQETAGRCIDKPAIPPTGCPYGDSIPLGPECDKHIPQTPVEQPLVTQESWGK